MYNSNKQHEIRKRARVKATAAVFFNEITFHRNVPNIQLCDLDLNSYVSGCFQLLQTFGTARMR